MTVDEAIEKLQKLKDAGLGDAPVFVQTGMESDPLEQIHPVAVLLTNGRPDIHVILL